MPNSLASSPADAPDIDAASLAGVMRVLPHRAQDLARLAMLWVGGEPVVTVIGKYNHGKSRLLNELMRRDAFAVADRRETVCLSERQHAGVRWLDAPGLDADVAGADDRHASTALWVRADVRLFVHSVKEGELDAAELALLETLRTDAVRTGRKVLLVLSQADQAGEEAALDRVVSAIAGQVPDMPRHLVSATRHRRGMEAAKPLLVARSGIPVLEAALSDALACVRQARAHETELLAGEMRAELEAVALRQATALKALRQQEADQRRAFEAELSALLETIGGEMAAVVDAPGPDLALVADSVGARYATTAAKQERARVQVAYSRACIRIDALLAGHGVSGLPRAQETAAASLNTVMVAVMGVSVKFRADLRRLFCTAQGRARLHADFAHYFDLSKDRLRLRGEIAAAAAAREAAIEARMALPAPETGA
ncbi:MAG: hypothetical protein B7Y95_02105 [Rhizobiales bacterium 32-66-11]|nr:MAG: hypothetical protein B7Y95_02105 [Rhizobiales bacterium 32-66-11]